MRLANEAIRRVRHPIPTVNDIRFALNGAKFFSKLDLSQAYHQLELHEQSRYVTTFSTHVGLYRYKRLNYGTNAAAEIFQYTLQTALQGLEGVKNIADDIIVFGSTRAEHDANLDKCLQRLAIKGLRLNQSKCDYLSSTLSFFGQVFSEDGTRPDPQRIVDLLNAPQPSNAHDVRSLLGMANYSSKTSARIERWVLRLQPYAFKIICKSGANNRADYLSRHPTNESRRKQEKMTEQYINFVNTAQCPQGNDLKGNTRCNECRRCINGAA